MAIRISEEKQTWAAKWLWRLAIAGVVVVFLIFIIISLGNLPTFEQLENPQEDVASEAYASDMSVLGRYYVENRVPIDYENISPYLIKALLATEDQRYFRHSGIDFHALGRVAVKSLVLQRETSGGGSTITQQLAKLLFDRPNLSNMGKIRRAYTLAITKFKEWITAVKLERSYTKEEILAMYLNHFDFLHNSHGIQAASETYFGKNQEDLKIEEAAMLVGMLQNPSYYNPMRRPELVAQRRMVVLKQMVNQGYLSEEKYDSLKALPVDMSNFKRSSHINGLAPYFRMEMRKELKDILSRKECLKPDGTRWDIDSDGLRIYTTIDHRIQLHAEEAMVKHMRKLQKIFFRHWELVREDPWEYDEDDSFVDVKLENLRSQIRYSDRYQILRDKTFSTELQKFEEYFDQEISDVDLVRMEHAQKEPTYLSEMVAKKYVSKKQKEFYDKTLKSEKGKELMSLWDSFQKEVDKVFAKKVKMRVFTYENSDFEKDTVMSPLDSIKYHRKHLQTGILAIDPHTGHIKAWVGGINMKYFQQDHIHTNRQVGSTFKPFVYSTAIAFQGISPCSQVYDIQYTISKGEGNFNMQNDWSPKNADDTYEAAPITLYEALRESKNTISVYLMKQISDVEPVRRLAANMGIDKSKLPPVPSLCLGSADISLYEMTGAYSAFANNGNYIKPTFIKQIEDKNGKLIYRSIETEEQALQPDANYVMVDMLKYALAGRGGSGELKSEVGGKTGTTQNHSDGWFMGITPSLVVGIWVGGEDRWIRFRDLANGQGSVMARPMFIDLIKRLEADPAADYDKDAHFYKPPGKLSITIDCDEYQNLHPLNKPESFEQEEEREFF
ncbi:MAG: penicillin-binding protein [Saprospiraceae bacterium]|nr:penicillin-binding protein [Saprospiraceae bacterium]